MSSTISQLSPSYNMLAHILNSIIKGLNASPKLPRLLIIVPENDILKFIVHYGFGISMLTGRCLNWLITSIVHAVEARKEEIRKCRPGALNNSEPKIVWVKMFDHPKVQDRMYAVREKYNNMLEEVLALKRNHYILDINNTMAQAKYFLLNGLITARAQRVFWQKLDEDMELLDYHELPLEPNPRQGNRPSNRNAKPEQYVKPYMYCN